MAALALGCVAAGAQETRLEVEASAARIAYDTTSALNAPSLSGAAEWMTPSVLVRGSVGATAFDGAGWSFQGRGSVASWASPTGPSSPFRVEVAGAGGGSRHSSGFHAWSAQADARLHWLHASMGAWLGAGLGRARNSADSAPVDGVIPSVGVWLERRSVRGLLSYTHSRIGGASYPEGDVTLTWTGGALDLSAYAGIRDSPFDAASLDERWAGASAAWWLSPRLALVATGGYYPADLLQGLPGGRFVSLGVRLTPRRVRPTPVRAATLIVYTSAQALAGTITFEVPTARRLEIAGDWNGWRPEPMSRGADGRWVVPAGIPAGVHRFNLRVDGERWMIPEGVPSVPDDFGGTVGLLVVSAPDEM